MITLQHTWESSLAPTHVTTLWHVPTLWQHCTNPVTTLPRQPCANPVRTLRQPYDNLKDNPVTTLKTTLSQAWHNDNLETTLWQPQDNHITTLRTLWQPFANDWLLTTFNTLLCTLHFTGVRAVPQSCPQLSLFQVLDQGGHSSELVISIWVAVSMYIIIHRITLGFSQVSCSTADTRYVVCTWATVLIPSMASKYFKWVWLQIPHPPIHHSYIHFRFGPGPHFDHWTLSRAWHTMPWGDRRGVDGL